MRPRIEEIQNENAGGSVAMGPMDNGIGIREVGLVRSVKTKKAPRSTGVCTENSAEKHIGNVALTAERHVIDLTRHEGINHIFVFRPVAHF